MNPYPLRDCISAVTVRTPPLAIHLIIYSLVLFRKEDRQKDFFLKKSTRNTYTASPPHTCKHKHTKPESITYQIKRPIGLGNTQTNQYGTQYNLLKYHRVCFVLAIYNQVLVLKCGLCPCDSIRESIFFNCETDIKRRLPLG